MELRQLRYFVAVAEERHFGRAARRLRIAAPSLSQQIQVLERDLQVILFERSPHRVILTSAGEVLLEHAHVLLARAERAYEEVRCADGRHRQLRLRIAPAVEHVLSERLRHLSGPISGVEVSIATSTDSDSILAIRKDHIDAAIVWVRSAQNQDLMGTVLRRVPVYLALPGGHRLAGRADVSVSDLVDETIVMFPRNLFVGIWDHIIGHLLPAGPSRPNQVLTQPDLINAPEALLGSVAAGRGVAPIVPAMAEHVTVSGVVVRPLNPPLLASVELIWREPAHPALEKVVALLSDAE
ncbi:LysR family transcriptional regulator [Mycolicibacterium cosmeticum]|uniref:LysR family transcriptional regulator n=1 Tax=Mycolicibacterium cosmeticum TaxID=258533 RepID=UPI003204EA76